VVVVVVVVRERAVTGANRSQYIVFVCLLQTAGSVWNDERQIVNKQTNESCIEIRILFWGSFERKEKKRNVGLVQNVG
jgi:hypothetical protein